jgi:hypothetical protein
LGDLAAKNEKYAELKSDTVQVVVDSPAFDDRLPMQIQAREGFKRGAK